MSSKKQDVSKDKTLKGSKTKSKSGEADDALVETKSSAKKTRKTASSTAKAKPKPKATNKASAKKAPTKKDLEKQLKATAKSKSGSSLAGGNEFEQLYAGRIRPKISHFTKQHQDHNIANISMEILFVDIYSMLEQEGIVEQEIFDSYAKPEMIEKTREAKVRHEKYGFIAKLLGLAPTIETQIIQEKYMNEGPSEFKKDIQDAIIFYHYARVEYADFNIEEIVKYMISNSFRKMGYEGYADNIQADIEKNKLKHINELYFKFDEHKDEIAKGFEDAIVEAHDLEPPKPD